MKLHRRNPLTLLALVFCLISPLSFADEASDFVEEASAKGLAEVQTGRLALEKAKSQDVKKFAQRMIEDHSSANQQLAALAKGANIKVADEAALTDKAKAMILKQRDGEDFETAYANNQVAAHEQTIELFSSYIETGKNAALKAFAQQTLPALKHHLEMAKALQAAHPEPE